MKFTAHHCATDGVEEYVGSYETVAEVKTSDQESDSRTKKITESLREAANAGQPHAHMIGLIDELDTKLANMDIEEKKRLADTDDLTLAYELAKIFCELPQN